MAPELLQTMEANELRDLAQKVREWQGAKGLSDNALIKKFASLGSTKTYKKILENDLAELDLERQLDNYRGAWAFIEAIGDEERGQEDRYDDLFATVQLRRVFTETSREQGLARAIFLLGPTGAGKSNAQAWLVERYGPRIVPIQATVAWGDSPNVLLAEILRRLGVTEVPQTANDRFNKVVEKLGSIRRALLIEDGHHMGPRCLSQIIGLIDQTPGEFVIAAIDTLWRRLETRAYEECRQLTGNRMAERINLGRDVRESDAMKLMERRVQWAAKTDCKASARFICEKANDYGRLAFVRETIKRANEKSEGAPMTAEMFAEAIQAEISSR